MKNTESIIKAFDTVGFLVAELREACMSHNSSGVESLLLTQYLEKACDLRMHLGSFVGAMERPE